MTTRAEHWHDALKAAWRALVLALVLIAYAVPARAGNNAGARVRLTWDPDWNTPSLEGAFGDTLVLYCRIEGAQDMRALGFVLEWEPRALPGCFQQVNPPERVPAGRVLIDEPPENPAFGGRSFRHRISYRAEVPRDLVAFAFAVSGCSEPTPTTFTLAFARARDSFGRTDDLHIIGPAFVGGELFSPAYNPPAHLATERHLEAMDDAWLRDVRTPRLLRRPIPQAVPGEPGPAAMVVLGLLGDRLRVSPGSVALYAVRRSAVSATVVFQQVAGSVPVLGGGLAVVLGRDGGVVRVSNHYIPGASNVSTVPSLDAGIARIAAARELGLPRDFLASGSPTLIVYPSLQTPLLTWSVPILGWTVFVDAHMGGVVGVQRTALAAMSDAEAVAWIPNPRVALQDSTVPLTRCDFSSIYQDVFIRDVTDSSGVWRLRGRFTDLYKYCNNTQPFQVTAEPGHLPRFASTRCIDGAVDPNGKFQQVLTYYFLDAANQYFYDHLQLQRSTCPDCALPQRVQFNCLPANYYANVRELAYNASTAEDAELVLHEYGHSLHHDQNGPAWDSPAVETFVLREGGIADFLATNLLSHEPLPYEFWVGEWATVGGDSKYLRNNTTFPWEWTGNSSYRDGHVLANALWDVFQAFEGAHACRALNAATYIDSCEARDQFYQRFAYGISEVSGFAGQSMHSVALAMLESDSLYGGEHLNGMVDAFDHHGWFFTEHDPTYGVDFVPVAIPTDTTATGPRFLALKLTSTTGVQEDSMFVHYGTQGLYPNQVAMVRNQGLGEGVYSTIIPTVNANNQFVNYYVRLKNNLGIWSHWPKSSPELDHAKWWLGTQSFRATFTDATPVTIAAGTKDTLEIAVEPGGTVFDLNVHLMLDVESPRFASFRLRHGDAEESLIDFGGERPQSSWPQNVDVWIDDEYDAPYHHFRPYRFRVLPPFPSMTVFNGSDRQGSWFLIVENDGPGAAALTLKTWELQIATEAPIGIADADVNGLEALILRTPHPNPFNAGTAIELVTGQSAHVRLGVYDVGGRLVRRMVDTRLPAGTHRFPWDGRNEHGQPVASGVYIFQAIADDVRMERKAVMIK